MPGYAVYLFDLLIKARSNGIISIRNLSGCCIIFTLLVLPVLAGIIAYLTFKICTVCRRAGISKLGSIDWLLEETPALFAFSLFLLECLIIAAPNTFALKQVSNHIIIALDIIYLLSILMLVLFHAFKIANHKSTEMISC
jgi:hypothetical protein